MEKIDITKIEGYADMTAEEKLAALEGLELPDPDYTGWVKKDLLDKATSQAADYKKQLRERMGAEEAAKAKADEDMATIMAELEALKTEKAVSEYTTQFMSLGYDEALAKSTAAAIQKGDMTTMFKNHSAFVVARDKAMKAELLKQTPAPPAGDGSGTMTKDTFKKMSLVEKQKFATENPEQYKALYSE